MKKAPFLWMLLLFGSFSINAQSSKSVIKQIKKDYKQIKNNQNFYTFYYSEIIGESTEGGEKKTYTNNKEFTVIEVDLFFETGNTHTEYYYKNKQLFFVFEKQATYNRPIYYDKDYALEEGDTEFFETKKTVFTENRYYFNNQKLIRWLNENKKEVNLMLSETKEKENTLLKEALNYLKN